MHKISDDDEGYGCWNDKNSAGFVLNVRRVPSLTYAVLHRATCKSISRLREDGAYTGRGYRKVVADNVVELQEYVRLLGRTDGSFSRVCGQCDPFGG